MVYADLHTHTRYSDGLLTPEALVREAQARGLAALSVTDHDTVGGVAEAQQAGAACGVEVVVGAEWSVTAGAREVHVLGYGFDPAHAGVQAHVRDFREARWARARGMTRRLHALGVPLPFEAVRRQVHVGAQEGSRPRAHVPHSDVPHSDVPETGMPGRPHVAAALVEAGWVETPEEAFERYIGDGGPAHVAKPPFPAEEALALLHEAGGIGVLAHPGHWTPTATLRALVRAGLDGVEVWHPSHDASLVRYYRRIARAFDLVETGGSDFHGRHADRLGTCGLSREAFARFQARIRHSS